MISTTNVRTRVLTPRDFDELAQDHLDGLSTDEDLSILQDHEQDWVEALKRLRQDVERSLERVSKNVQGPERELVLADFEDEKARIEGVLAELTDAPAPPLPPPPATEPPSVRRRRERQEAAESKGRDDTPAEPEPRTGTPQLQLSWDDGAVIAWSAGANAEPEPADKVLERLGDAGASPAAWTSRDPVPLPTGQHAEAVTAPVHATLGWLVALGTTTEDDGVGASVPWLGLVADLAVRLVASGRMVPQLDRRNGGGGGGGNRGRSTFGVHWEAALIGYEELNALANALPGAVALFDKRQDRRAVTRTIVSGFVDAICRDAAARVEVPAPPPKPRSTSEVAETFLARLDGTGFDALTQQGTEVSKAVNRWAKAIVGAPKLKLTVQLDPPDESNAWHLQTLAADGNQKTEPVDAAMSNSSKNRREAIKTELERLEELYPPLLRVKGERRGEVILSQDEAWELMTTVGPRLVAAGFDVRVPPLSKKKAAPGLRLTSMGSKDREVGSRQLTEVRWSAVFGDEELSVQDILRLAQESRPLVKSHGRWVEVDHADLEAAREALEEREKRDKLSGAEMLRYALGLEESPLPGGVSLSGEGWAANLLRSAQEIPEDPPTRPDGFEGELRGYQADALAWLGFLDSAGLGGCLALDMGLGKTPVMLANLRKRAGDGPSLVIAPPAVVGNWASEARKFVPDLKVVVHHGQNRADLSEVADEVADADVLLTTYGTAVRDIDALDDIEWTKVVLDEAQVIKNHTSETAQQLRRLEARSRVVLTGTPIENGLGDLWSLMDFVNPGLVGDRASFMSQLSKSQQGSSNAEQVLRTLNGVLVFRRTKAEPAVAAELPDRIDELDHCPMTPEQIGLYQAVLDDLMVASSGEGDKKKGKVLAAITALKQICNHPAAYTGEDGELAGRSGKLARLEEIVDNVFSADERVLIFTHFATWGEKLATHLSARTGVPIDCYHGGLSRTQRDKMVKDFQEGEGAGALVLSLKAGGTGLNLTAASHVVLYDRWWNPAVEDQARDRAWRIGQTKTVVAHRLVCPGTVDERVEEVVAGKRRIADLALPKSSTVDDLDRDQLQKALGIDADALLTDESYTETTKVSS